MGEHLNNPERVWFVTENWASRATCPRASVGCTLYNERDEFIAGGYNGAPEGQPTCLTDGCIMEGGHCIRAIHAEIRAITYAARRGLRLDGATALTTLLPCLQCLHALYQSGVRTVHYDKTYKRVEAEHVHGIANLLEVRLIERVQM